MPRKPKIAKQVIQVIVNGKPVAVTLYPPTASRRTWYVYWPGLTFSKSTGQTELGEAIVAAENMVKSGGKRATVTEAIMSDKEFEEIQRSFYARHQDGKAKARAAKSLVVCMEAISAFYDISDVSPITLATPDDCAAFQRKAIALPKNWRQQHPRSKKEVELLSPNTVLKWSRAMQAAFERVNRNAGRKCVRGIVDDKKLLRENPWKQFTWIEEIEKQIRQFDSGELIAVLDYLDTNWAGIVVANLLAKVCLWSSGRREEVTSLTWSQLRIVGSEYHFEITGKWGVEKWFRIPAGLHQELALLKTSSPYVFAAYNQQLRRFYEQKGNPSLVHLVAPEFKPEHLGDWFYKRIGEWSASTAGGRASIHVFRKTSLQYALSGESMSDRVAKDARVSERVLMTHYAKVTDRERRDESNRTFERILASLEPEVARRYGHEAVSGNDLEAKLDAAREARDWSLMAEITAELAGKRLPPTGEDRGPKNDRV